MQLSLFGTSSPSGPGPLPKCFWTVEGEVKVFPESAGLDYLRFGISHVPKRHMLRWHILLPFTSSHLRRLRRVHLCTVVFLQSGEWDHCPLAWVCLKPAPSLTRTRALTACGRAPPTWTGTDCQMSLLSLGLRTWLCWPLRPLVTAPESPSSVFLHTLLGAFSP